MSTRAERIQAASQSRRERERAETRQLILDAAETLLVERGYADLSLREVAERIGYSPAALYRYFEDKDHLVSVLHEEGFERFTAHLQEASDAHDDPLERIDALHDAYLEFARAHPVHYRLMFMERFDFLRDGPSDLDVNPPESLQILQSAVRDGMESGVVVGDSVEATSNAIWAAVHGAAALMSCMEDLPEAWKLELGESVRRLVRDGIRPRP